MSDFEYPSFTPEMIQEFNDSLSPKLSAPDTARKRSFKTKDGEQVQQTSWRESARIDSIVVAPNSTEAWGEHLLYKIKFVVTATKGSGKNVGKTTTAMLRTNNSPGGPDWRPTQSKRNTALLFQIIRAKGYDLSQGVSSAQFAAYFPREGDSPLVNTECEIEVSNKSNNDFSEVTNIYRLVTAEADAEV